MRNGPHTFQLTRRRSYSADGNAEARILCLDRASVIDQIESEIGEAAVAPLRALARKGTRQSLIELDALLKEMGYPQ
jgi:hypothetical protein